MQAGLRAALRVETAEAESFPEWDCPPGECPRSIKAKECADCPIALMEHEVRRTCDGETLSQARIVLRDARRYGTKGPRPVWSPEYEGLVQMANYEEALARDRQRRAEIAKAKRGR